MEEHRYGLAGAAMEMCLAATLASRGHSFGTYRDDATKLMVSVNKGMDDGWARDLDVTEMCEALDLAVAHED